MGAATTAATTTGPTGLLGWIATYGQYLGFVIQIIFYVSLTIAAVWAAWNFHRYVTNALGEQGEASGSEKEKDSTVAVDEFVE
jgi:hypothetical protein